MVKATHERSRSGDLRVKQAKKKSIKTTAPDIGSKRKLAKLGKRQKKFQSGTVTHFITRSKALRKLQISLKDFRRLCILKGIYPREPNKKLPGRAGKTYYHAKDVAYLSHEPLLDKFREMKAFTKKIKRQIGRNNIKEAQRLVKKTPEYSLDHLVRERYPTFESALADLDDALILINLFALLPVSSTMGANISLCAKLSREWQFYISRSHSLRKVFVSIKGIYYRVEVRGVPITYVIPHKFFQHMPRTVDFRVMKTFLEFYQTLLSFVMFKLYKEDLNMVYPPSISNESESIGALLRAVRPVLLSEQERLELDEKEKKQQQRGKKISFNSSLEKRLYEVASKAAKEQRVDAAPGNNNEEEGGDGEDFAMDDATNAIKKHQQETERLRTLFKDKAFFICRECPSDHLEVCIESFGGVSLRQDLNDSFNPALVTHVITDRDNHQKFPDAHVEYVQPQWVFDCANNALLLSTREYAPDSINLPPHLSPFVDDQAEGYVPARAEELLELKRAAFGGTEAVLEANHLLVREEEIVEDSSSSSSEEEEEEEEEEDDGEEDSQEEESEKEEEEQQAASSKPNKVEVVEFIKCDKFSGYRPGFFFRRGAQGNGYYADLQLRAKFDASKAMKQSMKKEIVNETVEAKQMRTMLMSRKAKNLYDRMQHGIAQKKEVIEELKAKRSKLEERSGKKQ